jgi:hypothetical protein
MTPEQLEERIRRAMATRTMTLPDLRPSRDPRRWRWIVLAAAAALVLIFLPLLQRREGVPAIGSVARTKAPPSDANPFLPAALMAQTSTRPAFAAAVQEGRQLRPGHWTYKLGQDDDTGMEVFRYDLTRSTHEGRDAWRMVTSFKSTTHGWRSNDTLWASFDAFHPLLRIGRAGNGARIEQTYRDHEVMVGTTYNGFTSWKVKEWSDSSDGTNGALIRMPDLAVQLRGLPLAADWKGSVALPTENETQIATNWLNFMADGEELIQTPAGTFLCWRLALVNPDGSRARSHSKDLESGIYFWVSKDRGWMIQSSFAVLGKRTSTYTLTEAVEE